MCHEIHNSKTEFKGGGNKTMRGDSKTVQKFDTETQLDVCLS